MTTLQAPPRQSAHPSGIEPVPRRSWGYSPAILPACSLAPSGLSRRDLRHHAAALGGRRAQRVYVKRPTFGADLLGDYLTLLLWGFWRRSDATRSPPRCGQGDYGGQTVDGARGAERGQLRARRRGGLASLQLAEHVAGCVGETARRVAFEVFCSASRQPSLTER